VLIPVLYLKGISTGDFAEALAALLGQNAGGLSASTIARLKEVWADEHARWLRRDLSAKHQARARRSLTFCRSLLSPRRLRACRALLQLPVRRWDYYSAEFHRPDRQVSSNLRKAGFMISSRCWRQRWNDLAHLTPRPTVDRRPSS
jgi:hypothetical protein